ncbi:unnamed protein product [Phyllotreta striolata]|uniref:Uncharacterized protein n=1 Tax=Phyllotreta striolata TaxID=444603 RepID=A0A9N9TI78_PHYSR|nr:unnamed protein product [Phyllotreta striolata]
MLQSKIDKGYKTLVDVPSRVHRYTSSEARSYRTGVSNQYYAQNPYPMPVLPRRKPIGVVPKFLKPIPVSLGRSLENLWKCHSVNNKIEEVKIIKLRQAHYSLNFKEIPNVSLIRSLDNETAGIKVETSDSTNLSSEEELSTPYDSSTSDIFDSPISNLQKKKSSPPGSSVDLLKGTDIFSFSLNDWTFIRAYFYIDTLSPSEPKNPVLPKEPKEPKKPKTLKQKYVLYKDEVLQKGDIKVDEKKYDSADRKIEVKNHKPDERKYKIIEVNKIKTDEIKQYKIVEISNNKTIKTRKEKNDKVKKNKGDKVKKEKIFKTKSTKLNTIKSGVFLNIPKIVKDQAEIVVPTCSVSESKKRKEKRNQKTKKVAISNHTLTSGQSDQEPENRKMEPSDVKQLPSMPSLQWNQYTYPVNNKSTQIYAHQPSEKTSTNEPDEYKFVDSLLDQCSNSIDEALVPDFDSILNELDITNPIIDPDHPENTLQMYPEDQEEKHLNLPEKNENLDATPLSNLPSTSQSNAVFQEHENCNLFSPCENNKENWNTNNSHSHISGNNKVIPSVPSIQTDCNVNNQNASDAEKLYNLNTYNISNYKYYSGGQIEYNRSTALDKDNLRNLQGSHLRPHSNQSHSTTPSFPEMTNFLHYQQAKYPNAKNTNSMNCSSRTTNNITSTLRSAHVLESRSVPYNAKPYDRRIPNGEVFKGNSMNAPIKSSYIQHQPVNISNVEPLRNVQTKRHHSRENQPVFSNGIASLQQINKSEITKDRPPYMGNPMYPMDSLCNVPKFPPGFDYLGHPFNHLMPPASLPYYHPYFNYGFPMLPPLYHHNYLHSMLRMRPVIGPSTKNV